MRMPKYQAWDNVKNRMYSVGEEYDVCFVWESSGIVGFDLNEEVDSPSYKLEHLKYRQYTGLKDRNGVEIYEGDIAHFIYGERPTVSSFDGGHDVVDGWTKEEVLEVKFVRGSFMIGKHLMWNLEDFPFDHSIKVIGNVYQGHEMLDQN